MFGELLIRQFAEFPNFAIGDDAADRLGSKKSPWSPEGFFQVSGVCP
jgi:hypothetical protein